MKVSLILAHTDGRSFNAALAATVRQAQLPTVIAQHCQELAQAQSLVVVHPNWWGMPPGILVGWLDQVLRPGVAYEFLEGDSGEAYPKAC